MCCIFPRKLLQNVDGFDEELDLYEDWDLLIRVGYDNPFYHIKKATAKYISGASICRLLSVLILW